MTDDENESEFENSCEPIQWPDVLPYVNILRVVLVLHVPPIGTLLKSASHFKQTKKNLMESARLHSTLSVLRLPSHPQPRYNVGEKPTVILYIYINRHVGTPEKH